MSVICVDRYSRKTNKPYTLSWIVLIYYLKTAISYNVYYFCYTGIYLESSNNGVGSFSYDIRILNCCAVRIKISVTGATDAERKDIVPELSKRIEQHVQFMDFVFLGPLYYAIFFNFILNLHPCNWRPAFSVEADVAIFGWCKLSTNDPKTCVLHSQMHVKKAARE